MRPAPGPSLRANLRLSQWLTMRPEGCVLVRSGKVELGQGVLTALTQIVAEELDVEPSRVRMVPATTAESPDESYTAGSLSVQHSGSALRAVCAHVRALHLQAAAATLQVEADELRITDGTILTRDGRSTTYWEQAADVSLDVDAEAAEVKAPAAYTVVGQPLSRVDIGDKVAGHPRFLHDLRPVGMLFGRVLRPPSRGAILVGVDETAARQVPGIVDVVRDGSFLGIIAEREESAVVAIEALRAGCQWSEGDPLPPEQDVMRVLRDGGVETTVLADTTTDEQSPPGQSVALRFSRPYLAHAAIGPSAAMARWDGGQVQVWSHTQGIYKLRAEICRSLSLPATDVVVQHVEGSGCYGHNAADDAAYDAVLLAGAAPGRHVQVVWSRQDELTWSPFGPAMEIEIRAELDAAGQVQRWQHEVWSNGHSGRPAGPGSPPLLAATHAQNARPVVPAVDPPLANGSGSGRNAVPLYAFPQQLVSTHLLTSMPLRTSALRALGAHLNVYAIEAMIDELAARAGRDPVGYRLGLLEDERARDVLAAAVELAGPRPEQHDGVGRGVGVARYKGTGAYCAVVADVEAESTVRVLRLAIAVDVGLAVNVDGVVNQVEGGALQALSWTTKEQVRFDARNVTSQDWEHYPILTFSEVPAVDVVVLDRPDQPSLGAGEASLGPTAAAIGNAVHDAIGIRVTRLPLTPENVIAAMGE